VSSEGRVRVRTAASERAFGHTQEPT
jgi:hypothetical protein